MTDPLPTTPPPANTLLGARRENQWFKYLCAGATWSSFGVLVVLLATVIYQSWGMVSWRFLTSFDSSKPEQAGILAGLWGTAWVVGLTMLLAVPIGIGAAIYLEENSHDNLFTRVIRVNLANLAGVPSVIYGILGLTVFVHMFGLFDAGGPVEHWTGRHVDRIVLWTKDSDGDGAISDEETVYIPLPFDRKAIAGALTLSLLILPMIIIATQEALRAVPQSLRHASLALGATHWQTVRHQVLPAALPGVITGIILACARAIGESAPLVVVGAATYIAYAPGNVTHLSDFFNSDDSSISVTKAPFDKFTVIPIVIFNWVRQTKKKFQNVAAAGLVVLMGLLVVFNALAVTIRARHQRKNRW